MCNGKKIVAIISIENLPNIGERFLVDNTDYLIKKSSCEQYDIKHIQIQPLIKDLGFSFFFDYLIAKIFVIISSHFKGNLKYKIESIGFAIKYYRYYKKSISAVDKVIMSFGMFKYSTQNYSMMFNLISKICDTKNISIMQNAVSVEPFNEQDWRCHQLKKAINRKCVKFFTTRDGMSGLELLRKNYINDSIFSDYVGDVALWIPECYKIETQSSACNLIGIGLIRKNICKDYNCTITGEQLFNIYKDTLLELEKRNYNWVLFHNGLDEDRQLGIDLLTELNLPSSKLLDVGDDVNEYLHTITQFKAIFGARYHACLAAYSLNIPCSGFYWDNKIRFFSESAGITSLFLEPENLCAESIIETIEKAQEIGYDQTLRNKLKNKTIEALDLFLST